MKEVRTDLFQTVTSRVKETVKTFDPTAEVILFGSRARGDYSTDSDWDFLILTEQDANNDFVNKVREEIFEVELETEQCFFSMIKNRNYWKAVEQTDVHKNISEEGVLI